MLLQMALFLNVYIFRCAFSLKNSQGRELCFFFSQLTDLYSAFFQNHYNELLLVIREEMYTHIF